MDKIIFYADKVKVNGPSVDGSFKITLEIGEDMQTQAALLLAIPQQTMIKVEVTPSDK